MLEDKQDEKEVKKSEFVHLHVHSMYSLSDALSSPKQIAQKAKELGFDAIALTDHSSLYGVVEFYESCEKEGIKPIIGVEANIAPDSLHDKRARIDNKMYHLTILVENDVGYHNLLRLVSISYLEGFYYKPRMDKEYLKKHGEGLIGLSGCMKGEIPKACNEDDLEKAERVVKQYQDVFGKDNFFLELVYHPESSTQMHINENLIKLAKKTGAPLVATRDSHYLTTDDIEAQDALQCIHDGKLLADINRHTIKMMDHSLNSAEDMINGFSHIPEAIKNTRLIADRCHLKLEFGKNLLPTFEVPDNYTEMSYLRKLTLDGLDQRYSGDIPKEALERLDYELGIIENMGFPGYFLIVNDYVVWAKEHGVIVGPGRGSAAGSLVAYALKITNLNPLKYGLLFERFLNPDRISMPDIDMDFDDVKRKDVIEYVTEKYGKDHVAGIITFGTMAARAAIRDVSRVLGWTFQEADVVAKVIPPPVQGKNIPLSVSCKENSELKALYDNDPKVKRLVDLASRLEGTARHTSQHACGIVIAPRPLVEFAPLQKAQGGDVEQIVQYSLHPSEAIGLLKMDFLGLSNLTIIRECLEIIEAVHGDKINIDEIPLDDKKTFELLGNAETTGVFQLESDGMKRYIRDLKPSKIEDIIAMVALYRPGPMQFIDSFIKRKHGKEKIKYKHSLTESALKETYGIPVYQEQIMQVSKDMAGFTGGQADTLRKAMGKKKIALMEKMKEKFIEGSIKNGVDKQVAIDIFQQFEEFAAYGFNKSHAACYAMIAYQTAYLKAYYPEAFMAALLNSDCFNLDRVTIEVEECRRMNIEVLPPDINESFQGFSVLKNSIKSVKERDKGGLGIIRFGLLAIKGLGHDVVEEIVKGRKENGSFKDLTDFVSRIKGKYINKKSLEALVRSGALDSFGSRGQLYYNIENILAFHKQIEREANSGQVNLFAMNTDDNVHRIHLQSAPDIDEQQLLAWEKELLGLYVSKHPFLEIADRLGDSVLKIVDLEQKKAEKKVRVAGILTALKKIYTKKNEPMAFGRLEDGHNDCEVVIFPRVYKESVNLWTEDRMLVVSGRPADDNGKMKVLVETAYEITEANLEDITKPLYCCDENNVQDFVKNEISDSACSLEKRQQRVRIQISSTLPKAIIDRLQEIFNNSLGNTLVEFEIHRDSGLERVLSNIKINLTTEVRNQIEEILGSGTVRF